jgi:putative oxidoreductase
MWRNERVGLGLLVLRLGLGAVFVAHGSVKLFGGHLSFIQEMLTIVGVTLPNSLLLLVAIVELLGGLALISGFLARPFAAILAAEMLVTVVIFHAAQGFFIVALPNAPLAYGFEFHVVLISGLLCIALAGPGALALGSRVSAGRAVSSDGLEAAADYSATGDD